MDVDKIEEKITSKTKAIIPVHLFGQPVYNMDKLLDISKHNLRIIEYRAQSHFSMSNNSCWYFRRYRNFQFLS